MVLANALLQRLDLDAAAAAELSTTNRLMPRRWDRLALVDRGPAIAGWLKGRYRRERPGPPASIVFVDKNRKGMRPISEISLEDRVLYRALVTLIAESLPQELVNRPPIATFRESPLASPNARYISKTDVSAYYEFIDHELLHDELLAQTGEALAIEALMVLLERIMGRRVGLPQVHKASDILGDTYIAPAARRLRRAGYDVYTFSDDFRIATASLGAARNALEACAAEVRTLGLVLNESKTYTYGKRNYRASLTAFSDAEGRLFDEDTELDGLRLFFESDYSDEDESVEPPLGLSGSEIEGVADTDAIQESHTKDRTDDAVDEAQVRAATRTWELWLEEDESDEVQSSQDAAITESLLSRSLPILGAAGNTQPLEYMSAVLRFEPALTPQAAKYLVALGATGKAARTAIRVQLDALSREENFSTWQKMWLVDAAGSIRRSTTRHEHYAWLVESVREGAPALAATAAAALGRLGLSEELVVVGALDRVGPSWRPLMLWSLALMDESQAEANREDRLDQMVIEVARSWFQQS
ncbi:reverse transcriptase domain-containing protein [Knoellia sp. CPCC 206435]|uniref:reverse transcriptase domain-containing protein n=1 Tax=Knoellia terrae TaxID=3404797 RepID=UPI003B42AF07